jgi:hypothetical protein
MAKQLDPPTKTSELLLRAQPLLDCTLGNDHAATYSHDA